MDNSLTPFSPETRIQLAPNQSASVLGEETVVVNFEVGNYYELNEVGGAVWACLQDGQPRTVGELETYLQTEFEVDPGVCRAELSVFLTELQAEKLIDVLP